MHMTIASGFNEPQRSAASLFELTAHSSRAAKLTHAGKLSFNEMIEIVNNATKHTRMGWLGEAAKNIFYIIYMF